MQRLKYLGIILLLFPSVAYPCTPNELNALFTKGEVCTEFESELVSKLKTELLFRKDYCLLHKDCVVSEQSSNVIDNSSSMLREMTIQSLSPIFENIASAKNLLDAEFSKGSLDQCSLQAFDRFPTDCQGKLKKYKITSNEISRAIDGILIGSDSKGAKNNQCLTNADRLYFNTIQKEQLTVDKLIADKKVFESLLKETNKIKFTKILQEKFGPNFSTIMQNSRLSVVLSSQEQFKEYINNGRKITDFNKDEWAAQLNVSCQKTFTNLQGYLCNTVPSESFVFEDYKLYKKFGFDDNKNFKDEFCKAENKSISLSAPFDVNNVNPNYNKSVISSTARVNNDLCPLYNKCSSSNNSIECLKNECSSIINLSKSELNKTKGLSERKIYCEDLFDFKNGGAVKNQELVNFLAEKRDSSGALNGLASANQSKLMNYFITPAGPDKIVTSKDQTSNGKSSSVNGVIPQQSNQNTSNASQFTGANGVQNIQPSGQNSIKTNNTGSSTKSVQNQNGSGNSETIDTSSYEKTIQAQNELLDRLERAKNQQNNDSNGNKNTNSVVKNNKYVPSDDYQKDLKNTGDKGIPNQNDPSNSNGNTVASNNDNTKPKNAERGISANGAPSSTKDSGKLGNAGVSGNFVDGTSLEQKNNISSSMEVNKDGQYKVTLRNLDPKTLNMELFKDEIKKQAKDAIDKGIPFVISIVNNDKEITINMIPKEKNGKITYVPAPKDDSAESLAFAEKLKNSFHSEAKTKTDSNVKRSKLSELENSLK